MFLVLLNILFDHLQDSHLHSMRDRKVSDDDVPSVPPFGDSSMEASQGTANNSITGVHGTPGTRNGNEFSIRKDSAASGNMNSAAGAQCNMGKRSPDQSGRFA